VKTRDKVYRVDRFFSSVWLMLDLFPDDACPPFDFGQQVEPKFKSGPGEVFTGRVRVIDPTVNAKRERSCSCRDYEF